jgi:pre-mRNA-splicing factor 38A
MANRTDPLIAALSGTDPQNRMEYITRQRIYDSRYWKEECFGLSVADVLEKAIQLTCIGGLPTRFLSLTLKLLQLNPESDLIIETFIQQEDYKYVRALGCLYLRLTGRPVEIYESMEPLYNDTRKLRVYLAPEWQLITMDQYIDQLLSTANSQGIVVGITLPRLPARRTLMEAGYLPDDEPWGRPTSLKEALERHGGPLEYLRHKTMVEKCPEAVALWEKREARENKRKKPSLNVLQVNESTNSSAAALDRSSASADKGSAAVEESQDLSLSTFLHDKPVSEAEAEPVEKKPKKKKKERNYDNLFKKSKNVDDKSARVPSTSDNAAQSRGAAPEEGSEEYWNQQREKLGLKPLR